MMDNTASRSPYEVRVITLWDCLYGVRVMHM